jgi:hypothetical protein
LKQIDFRQKYIARKKEKIEDFETHFRIYVPKNPIHLWLETTKISPTHCIVILQSNFEKFENNSFNARNVGADRVESGRVPIIK